MKAKTCVLIAAMLLATACGEKPQPRGADVATCPEPFYALLPDSAIRFDFQFHLNSDRIYATSAGETRRRIVVEYLEGDVTDVWQKIEAAMTSAGYRLRADKNREYGKGTFTKEGSASLFVDATGKRTMKPAHPSARGTIWVSWPVTGVSVPDAGGRAATPGRPTTDATAGG